MVKNLPAMRETRVPSLGREDPLGKGRATHLSILAWEIPMDREPGGLQSMGSQRVRHNTFTFFCLNQSCLLRPSFHHLLEKTNYSCPIPISLINRQQSCSVSKMSCSPEPRERGES